MRFFERIGCFDGAIGRLWLRLRNVIPILRFQQSNKYLLSLGLPRAWFSAYFFIRLFLFSDFCSSPNNHCFFIQLFGFASCVHDKQQAENRFWSKSRSSLRNFHLITLLLLPPSLLCSGLAVISGKWMDGKPNMIEIALSCPRAELQSDKIFEDVIKVDPKWTPRNVYPVLVLKK